MRRPIEEAIRQLDEELSLLKNRLPGRGNGTRASAKSGVAVGTASSRLQTEPLGATPAAAVHIKAKTEP